MRMLLIASVVATSAFAEGQWTLLRTEADGLRVESREVPASQFLEFRVTAHSEANLSALTEAVWRWNDKGIEAQMIEQRKVLTETAQERLVWSVMRPPVISRRESFIRFQKRGDRTHSIIDFASENGDSPEGTNALRMRIRGAWNFEVDPTGGTRVEHRILSDPGGSVPPWLVKGTQADFVVKIVREKLQQAAKN